MITFLNKRCLTTHHLFPAIPDFVSNTGNDIYPNLMNTKEKFVNPKFLFFS